MTDRVCEDCQAGRFSILSNQEQCKVWSNCSAGTYISSAGSATINRVCAACAAGRFTNSSNLDKCQEWTVCDGLETETGTPSAFKDRTCEVKPPKIRFVEDELDFGEANCFHWVCVVSVVLNVFLKNLN